MKKLFLTSGIIACMACPAFADPTGFPATNGSTAAGAGTEACVEPTIGVYENNTTMVAQWTANYGVMQLNENDGANTANGGATPLTYDTTTPTNDHLWLTPYDATTKAGAGVYRRTGDSEANYVFTKQSVNDTVITVPAGINVTYNRTDALPATASTSVATPSTSTTENRTFRGYFPYGSDNTTQDSAALITADGKLTTAGDAAAATYNNNQPWVALYALVSPVVTDPVAYGYNFNGWYVDGGSTVVPTASLPGNIGENTALVANWSPVTYAVSYNCGTGLGTPSVQNNTATFDSVYTWAGNNDSTTGTQNCHKNGYHFTGWTCTATLGTGATVELVNNGGTYYEDDNNPATTADQNPSSYTGKSAAGADGKWQYANLDAGTTVSCVAQYAQNVVTISWTDPEGGNAPTTNTCTYEGDVTLPADPSRTGYVFNGWTVNNTPAQTEQPSQTEQP